MALEVGAQGAAVPTIDAYKGAFSAIGRLFQACSSGWQAPAPEFDAMLPAARSAGRELVLADLADGPYYTIAMQLGPRDLARADCACRLTRELNRSSGGPWWALGRRAFHGLELDGDTIFDPADNGTPQSMRGAGRKVVRWAWKSRYLRFAAEVKLFRAPFSSFEITTVKQADEIAFSRCKLRTDVLQASGSIGVYLEVEVLANPDNVSLAVVDFEAGGCSSVTFSPDTGAVIRERKIREAPRKVEGTYIQPLSTITSGQGFEGSMGLYFKGGRLAFFRRHFDRSSEAAPVGRWETTGFVTDLSWAEGRRLTPCLAFRDIGDYHLRITRISADPPVELEHPMPARDEHTWRSLDWDAEQEALES